MIPTDGTMSVLSVAILLLFRAAAFSAAGNCEVCVVFLHRLYGSLTSGHTELSPVLVEEELVRACTVAQGKEARLCYYLGASSDAATRVTASVSRPLASHVPVEKICQRLGSGDTQICQLRYEPRPKDLSSDGLKKMRVLELRKILASWGEECRGCLEKHEFVSLIQEKAPLHDHTVEL
ncbi:putative mesencephalic astrocyte-derived neurotrophic factor-like [Scophthalmus maximus]|uniref:Putative mesencephalic astrocyte-derived neurotrophic factor-like n=1 Tax=Scophthalmus maximus TaxID=52904 RepID=A0A2U9BAK6_SCOMX|nr:putative mesencephalic astrocyte-derived neurotrophic factor-like [Scophthalmus maximus]